MTVLNIREANLTRAQAGVRDRSGKPGHMYRDIEGRAKIVMAAAARHAVAVDEAARFPEEAIAAAREQRLLGIMVPQELGGEGASVSDGVDICYRLGRACSSTAMIYAMHQTKVACLVRHGRGSPWHERLLRRLCAEQMLLASSTTEGQGGGNVRASQAPIERDGARIALERNAAVISYGAQADGIVTTARRSADASSSDQVLVAFTKEDYSLEPKLTWDTLGMRGTCSAGFTLKASGEIGQILPDPYKKIHARTMTPVAHLMWAGAWAGIATDAVERARSFIRKASRQANGQLPPGAAQFAKASSSLGMLRSLVACALGRYEAAAEDERALASIDFQTMINLTKVDAAELAVATVMSALRACGLSGYRNDGEFSVSRHLRDVLSSPLMINNDRIISNISTALLMGATPASLTD
ncbi:MAG: acyl-CoA dehydrogenase family protein [Hyphomicrobiales bacterium]